jgi:alkylation response protein AidB-like acyl-CoA dehydrogenase
VLDHVIPYVNQRETFGEPISHRQSVAFAVADIAVELEGMRLVTYRAASLADQGEPFGHAAALARDLCARQGHGRSAPTACSCSAATATSRSTRWSAGTATCGPWA